jgi:hypothetical protein
MGFKKMSFEDDIKLLRLTVCSSTVRETAAYQSMLSERQLMKHSHLSITSVKKETRSFKKFVSVFIKI